jgi:hypothetical protein
VWLASTSVVARVNYQEIFLQANKLYKDGEFQKAYDLYKTIHVKSPELAFNKGNCAYQLGEYGYALLYWRRAERDWGLFNRSELLDNISLLYAKLSKKTPFKNGFIVFLKRATHYVTSLMRSISLFYLQIIFLFLWILLFLYLRHLYKKKSKWLIIILFLLVALFGTLLVFKYSLSYAKQGIVIRKNVALLSGPGNKFQQLGTLPEAVEVVIQKRSDLFYKVTFQRQIGWVKQSDIEAIV